MIKLCKAILPIMVMGMVSSCFADTYQDAQTALNHKMYTEAATQFENACEHGNAKGCFQLGALYEKGDGVVQNKYKAVSLYTQACNGGETHGCSNIALMYDTP